ncbi:DnaJ domain-containing protein [Methanomicrobium sp. W14]|uniref:DnaJ domain-containing protein n=1 Tax=Methanomicrobium sp. W14 TaxID=2817839 RepID=UPI001AE444C5|nr:DnaJ domain-containing protein [Methanomicrobium sp. W14]
MPEREDTEDYYEILGIDDDADENEIKKAYRSLARAFHPDTSTHPNAKKMFILVNEAYETLSDSAKRSDYDRLLKESRSLSSNEPGPENQTENSYTKNDDRNCDTDEGDEFSKMADLEYYSDEPESYLVNGLKRTFENARHIIAGNTEYIIDGDEMINVGEIRKFTCRNEEKYLINGEEYRIKNALHYHTNDTEYVVIDDKPYRIRNP